MSPEITTEYADVVIAGTVLLACTLHSIYRAPIVW